MSMNLILVVLSVMVVALFVNGIHTEVLPAIRESLVVTLPYSAKLTVQSGTWFENEHCIAEAITHSDEDGDFVVEIYDWNMNFLSLSSANTTTFFENMEMSDYHDLFSSIAMRKEAVENERNLEILKGGN